MDECKYRVFKYIDNQEKCEYIEEYRFSDGDVAKLVLRSTCLVCRILNLITATRNPCL